MNKVASLWLMSLFVVLTGCSSLKAPPEPSAAAKTAYEANRTLPNAVTLAESLRDAYLARSADLRQEERINGLALIGMGVMTGDLVARGIARSETLGLGLTGVGLYSANNWANPKSERVVYAESAGAVQCAINVVEPMRAAYEGQATLQQGKDKLKPDADALDAMLKDFDGSEEPRVVRARNAVVKARAVAAAAEAAQGYLKALGPALATAIGGVRVDVEVQLVRGGPDYTSLVGSLIQQKVLPATMPLSLPDSKVKESGAASTLDRPTAELEALTATLEKAVEMLNVRPSVADMQRCRIDPKAVGITMKVEPSVLTVKAGERSVALASGGTLPYAVSVLADAVIADQLVFTVAGNGVITIEAKSGAKAATYTTYVTDGGKGRETLIVTVTPAAAAAPAPAPVAPPAPTAVAPAGACAKPDAAVKELQEGLRTLGLTNVKVDGVDKELLADGCPGKITSAAMKQLYVGQGMPEGDVEKDEAKLLKQAMADVKDAVAKKKAQPTQ